jgi:hypothetical protein
MNGLSEKHIAVNKASLGKDPFCHFQVLIYEIPCKLNYFNKEISDPFGRTVWQVSFGSIYFCSHPVSHLGYFSVIGQGRIAVLTHTDLVSRGHYLQFYPTYT